jgi:hypothetical protein
MAKSLLYMCVDHPTMAALARNSKDIISLKEAYRLMVPRNACDNLDYDLTIFCSEGSPRDLQLAESGFIEDYHVYSVVKIIRTTEG